MPSDLPERSPEPERNGDEPDRRSGAGLRVAIYFLAVFLATTLAQGVFLQVLLGAEEVERLTEAMRADPSAPPPIEPIIELWLQGLTAPLALLVTLLFLRVFDDRRPRSIGLSAPSKPGLQLFLGALLAALPLGAFLVLSAPWVESTLEPFDAATLAADPHLPLEPLGLVGLAVAFLAAAFAHELIFRGYIYSTFRDRFAWVNAAGLTNLLAVALYAGETGIGAAALINIFLLGLAMAALREKTGDLFLATVFSALWNLLLGAALSLPVSGRLFPRLFDHDLRGPDALTGGPFGPEGSWLLTGPLVVLVVGLAVWVESGREEETDEDGEAEMSSEP